jgi:hypothetical protein
LSELFHEKRREREGGLKTNLMGLVSDLSNTDYHAHGALSSSGLRELAKSPAHYMAYKTQERVETPAMKFGTGFHELIGEPQLFDKKYVKGPAKEDFEGLLVTVQDIHAKIKELGHKTSIPIKKSDAIKLLRTLDPRVPVWDDIVEAFTKENEGKTVLSADEYAQLDGMLHSLIHNKTAVNLLTKGKAEQSAFWIDKATGVLCKCRPDYLRDDGIVIDLKTTEDASLKGFQRSLANYAYHWQSAFYLQGLSAVLGEPLTEFVHIVVEKKPPYAVAIYTLDDSALLKAREEIAELLKIYAECSAKNEWPAFTQDIQNISLPAWMY